MVLFAGQRRCLLGGRCRQPYHNPPGPPWLQRQEPAPGPRREGINPLENRVRTQSIRSGCACQGNDGCRFRSDDVLQRCELAGTVAVQTHRVEWCLFAGQRRCLLGGRCRQPYHNPPGPLRLQQRQEPAPRPRCEGMPPSESAVRTQRIRSGYACQGNDGRHFRSDVLQHCELAGTVAVQTHCDEWFSLQANADASLAAGAVNPTTIRQGLLGFSGRNLLQDPVVKVSTPLRIE